MGTCNFNNSQASRIFAVGEDNNEDEFIWDDTRDNVSWELLEIDKDKAIDWEFVTGDKLDIEELRSFPATSIGQLYSDISYGGMDFSITIIPKTVSGYYAGFNLDFDIMVTNDQGYGEITNDGVEEGVSKEDMEYMFEEYAGIPVEVELGSEFRYRKPIVNAKTAAGALTAMHNSTISSTGGGQAHNNMQPILTINFAIALQGLFPSRN